MIPVVCHTNLDLANEVFPDKLPCIPNVGDEIESKTDHKCFHLTLQVVRIIYQYNKQFDGWIPYIELHMTEFQKRMSSKSGRGQTGSIIAFYEWYAPLVGRSVSSFV